MSSAAREAAYGAAPAGCVGRSGGPPGTAAPTGIVYIFGVGADIIRPAFYRQPPHQCRPRKLHMPQGSLSCPCGAIHLLIFHGINAMAHSLRCSSSPQCDRLRWVTLGVPACSTASPLRGKPINRIGKAFPLPGGRWHGAAMTDEGASADLPPLPSPAAAPPSYF